MKKEIEKLTKQIEELTAEVKRLRESQSVVWPIYKYTNPDPNPYRELYPITCVSYVS